MAETITHTWQTVEQAAVILNVSTRTVARRLAGGSLESRVDENGRRLVLIQQINATGSNSGEAGVGEAGDEAGDDSGLAAIAGPIAASISSPAVMNSQAVTMLTVLETTVTAAREDAAASRRTAKWAWAGTAAMAAVLIAGAAVVSSTLTRTTVTTGMLREQLAETKGELRQTQSELMATRTAEAQATRDLTEARQTVEQTRRFETATVRPTAAAAAGPATQPTLIDRVVSLFGE